MRAGVSLMAGMTRQPAARFTLSQTQEYTLT